MNTDDVKISWIQQQSSVLVGIVPGTQFQVTISITDDARYVVKTIEERHTQTRKISFEREVTKDASPFVARKMAEQYLRNRAKQKYSTPNIDIMSKNELTEQLLDAFKDVL